MRASRTALAICILLGTAATIPDAEAARTGDTRATARGAVAKPGREAGQKPVASLGRSSRVQHAASGARHGGMRVARARFAGGGGGGISCVPYARMITGMAISGNGGDWWGNAAGSYDRGNRPEPGSVMAFRASGGMRRGHVAVVSRIVGPRHVLIDHANWGGPGIRRGSIMHNVSVIDVSDANDWTAVRVQTGYDTTNYGRTYPVYGFIYNRPDDGGTAYAANRARGGLRIDQVADAPIGGSPVAFQLQGFGARSAAAATSRSAPRRGR